MHVSEHFEIEYVWECCLTIIKSDDWKYDGCFHQLHVKTLLTYLCMVASSFLHRMSPFEPSLEIMVHFILRKLILQTRMCSRPMGLDVYCLVGPFVYFHTLCVRIAKALVRVHGCAGSPESSLVDYVISTIIS